MPIGVLIPSPRLFMKRLGTLFFAIIAVGITFWWLRHQPPQNQPVTPSFPETPALVETHNSPPPQVNSLSETNELTADDVQLRINDLERASFHNDESSFKLIVTSLKSDNIEIRKAAIEAAMQSGDRATVPSLKELAGRTRDTLEKKLLLDAVAYLELPSLTELKAQLKTNAPSTNR
ncbi:MAG: HEAT repeat domain-containing protein [Verrucomicrobiota bacterium]